MTTVSTRHLAPVHTSINDEPQEIHVDEVGEMQEIPVDVVRDYPVLLEKPFKATSIKPGNTPQTLLWKL